MDRDTKFELARKEHEAFVRALGELTLTWSDLETVLFKLLKHYACVNDAVGRAVFSGTRAKAAMNFIRAIADNTDMDATRKVDLEEIFSQVTAINTMRDFVVHHVDGSEQEFEDDNPAERVLTDELRASRKKNAKLVYIGSSAILAMREDCLECCWRLHAHWKQPAERFVPGPGAGGVRNTWKFKPPQPTRRGVRRK